MYIHTTTAKRTMKVIHTHTLALGLPHGEERIRGLRPAEREEGGISPKGKYILYKRKE